MRIDGYWLGAALIMLSGLILDTIKHDDMDWFITFFYFFTIVLLFGLAFPKEQK